nr:hypothetical protein [Tanacetum cinerariifolium]
MDLLNQLLETCATLTKKVGNLEQDKIAQAIEITKLKQRVRKLEKKRKLKASGRMHPNREGIAEIVADEDATLEEVATEVIKDAEDDEAKPTELTKVIKVVTTTKLMTEVVTAATTITAAPMPNAVLQGEKRDEAYARELEVELNANINWNEVIVQVKRKEKQDNTVMRYQALKRKPQTEAQARKNMMVYLKNMAGFKMDFFKGMSYDDIRPIFEKHFNSNWAFLEKYEKELEEEASKVIKRKSETSKEKAVKKQKLDEEVEEIKTHLQIVPNNEDDVYTEATPLALKRRLGDAMENCSRKFTSSEPKNFSDDFLLNTLKTMFKKPNVEAHMILLVEKRHHLTRFTLDQMLNNIRLEVEEESEVSLELLRFMRRQQQEGYRPDFRVDAVKDFKEYMLRDYYCWLKTYRCWYKLKLLDDAAHSRLRLLEESATADEKIKKLL